MLYILYAFIFFYIFFVQSIALQRLSQTNNSENYFCHSNCSCLLKVTLVVTFNRSSAFKFISRLKIDRCDKDICFVSRSSGTSQISKCSISLGFKILIASNENHQQKSSDYSFSDRSQHFCQVLNLTARRHRKRDFFRAS